MRSGKGLHNWEDRQDGVLTESLLSLFELRRKPSQPQRPPYRIPPDADFDGENAMRLRAHQQCFRHACGFQKHRCRGFRRRSRGVDPGAASSYDSTNWTPEWRNWQTRGTQNPVSREGRVGSTPTSGTRTLRTKLGSQAFVVRVPEAVAFHERGFRKKCFLHLDSRAESPRCSRRIPTMARDDHEASSSLAG